MSERSNGRAFSILDPTDVGALVNSSARFRRHMDAPTRLFTLNLPVRERERDAGERVSIINGSVMMRKGQQRKIGAARHPATTNDDDGD